jgi:HAD superfamily hydrolase (TIGR01509 family)
LTIKVIIFDCDGTLVDSEVLANEVLVDYLAECGHVMTVESAVRAYTGIKMAECVADLERRFRTPMPDRFIDVYRERMTSAFADRLRPVRGADALLSSLELPVYIASSGPREKIQNSLNVTGLQGYFSGRDSIFSAYELGHWKPDPAFYRAVIDRLGVLPTDAVVIEDSLPGIRSALGAGVVTIALGPGERLSGELAGAIYAADLLEAGEIVRGLVEERERVP